MIRHAVCRLPFGLNCPHDLTHVAMVDNCHMAIVPGDRDRVPSCFGDSPAVSGVTLPIDASTLRKGFGFGGIYTTLNGRSRP